MIEAATFFDEEVIDRGGRVPGAAGSVQGSLNARGALEALKGGGED